MPVSDCSHLCCVKTVSVLCNYVFDDIEFAGVECLRRPIDGVGMIELLHHCDVVWFSLFAWKSDVVNICMVDLAVCAVVDVPLAE